MCIRDSVRSIYSVSWTGGDGLGKIAAAGADGNIIVFGVRELADKLDSDLIARVDRAHGISDINCVAWAPSAPLLASGGDDGNVHIWAM